MFFWLGKGWRNTGIRKQRSCCITGFISVMLEGASAVSVGHHSSGWSWWLLFMWSDVHTGAVLDNGQIYSCPVPSISKDPFILGKSDLSSILYLPSLDECPITGTHENLQGPLQCLLRGGENKEHGFSFVLQSILYRSLFKPWWSATSVGFPSAEILQKRVTHPCNFKGCIVPHLAQLHDSTSTGLLVLCPWEAFSQGGCQDFPVSLKEFLGASPTQCQQGKSTWGELASPHELCTPQSL